MTSFWEDGSSLVSVLHIVLYTWQFHDTFTVGAVGRKSGSDETLYRILSAVSSLLRVCDDVSGFMQISLLAQVGSPHIAATESTKAARVTCQSM